MESASFVEKIFREPYNLNEPLSLSLSTPRYLSLLNKPAASNSKTLGTVGIPVERTDRILPPK